MKLSAEWLTKQLLAASRQPLLASLMPDNVVHYQYWMLLWCIVGTCLAGTGILVLILGLWTGVIMLPLSALAWMGVRQCVRGVARLRGENLMERR